MENSAKIFKHRPLFVLRDGEVRLSRLPHKQKIASSNLAPATSSSVHETESRRISLIDSHGKINYIRNRQT